MNGIPQHETPLEKAWRQSREEFQRDQAERRELDAMHRVTKNAPVELIQHLYRAGRIN